MAGFSIHSYLGCLNLSSIYVVMSSGHLPESTIRGSKKGAMEGERHHAD